MQPQYGAAMTIALLIRPAWSRMPAGTGGGRRQIASIASAAIWAAPYQVHNKGIDQQPLAFFEQSTGCAGLGAIADPTNNPTPIIMATANSNFRI